MYQAQHLLKSTMTFHQKQGKKHRSPTNETIAGKIAIIPINIEPGKVTLVVNVSI